MYKKEEFVNAYNLTVEQVKEEVTHLSLENIRHFPCSPSVRDNFYSMWQRFGPDSARTMMIPYVWQGKVPLPSTYEATKAA